MADLRKLHLSLEEDRIVYNPQHFVELFDLQKEFKKEFGMEIEDWDFTCTDDEVYYEMLKYINTENKIYKVIWDDSLEENVFYTITTNIQPIPNEAKEID